MSVQSLENLTFIKPQSEIDNYKMQEFDQNNLLEKDDDDKNLSDLNNQNDKKESCEFENINETQVINKKGKKNNKNKKSKFTTKNLSTFDEKDIKNT